jgi:DNA-binding NtrC family response regulator
MLVLEEIDQLPPDTQAAVLRILRDREAVDVRLIATASRDLEALVGAEVFRKDLYYALNVLALTVPPLRDRAEEIAGLAEFFRTTFMERYRRDTGHLSDELTTTFVGYHWPGNVRELEGVVKRYVVLGGEQDIREELRTRARTITAGACLLAFPGEIGLSLKQIGQRAAQRAEKAAMLATLERVNWNRAEAARCLKISYKTLLNKLNQSPAAPGRHQRKS